MIDISYIIWVTVFERKFTHDDHICLEARRVAYRSITDHLDNYFDPIIDHIEDRRFCNQHLKQEISGNA